MREDILMGNFISFDKTFNNRACPCCGRPLVRGHLFRMNVAFDRLYEFSKQGVEKNVVEFGYSEDNTVKFYDWQSFGTLFLCEDCGDHIMWLAGQDGFESELDPEEIRRTHGK